MNTRELMVRLESIQNKMRQRQYIEAESELTSLAATLAVTETVLNDVDCWDIISEYDTGMIAFPTLLRKVRTRTDCTLSELKRFCEKFR